MIRRGNRAPVDARSFAVLGGRDPVELNHTTSGVRIYLRDNQRQSLKRLTDEELRQLEVIRAKLDAPEEPKRLPE